MPIQFGARASKTIDLPDTNMTVSLQARLKQATPFEKDLCELKPSKRATKKHSEMKIDNLSKMIDRYAYLSPIVIDETNEILAGHARYEAATALKIQQVSVIQLRGLTDAEKRFFRIAHNKLADVATYDVDMLADELNFVINADLDFDYRISGFETTEIDCLLSERDAKHSSSETDEAPFELPDKAVTRHGDIWICGNHLLLCGNSLEQESYDRLLGNDRARMCFTDPPYNVPNAGHVTKRPGVREFPMAAGEMTPAEFRGFLSQSAALVASAMEDGAVIYMCMDWRHYPDLVEAARPSLGNPKNLITWVKSNAGNGSFYRSQHELIAVYAKPGPRTNNFGLGAKGRYRTNVWQYPGCSSFSRDRNSLLAMHPTAKPVAMIQDAIMDCSNRRDLILDPFAGSGTTMIAAERAGRHARLIELDALYCDVIVRRWQTQLHTTAALADTNEPFELVAKRRAAEGEER